MKKYIPIFLFITAGIYFILFGIYYLNALGKITFNFRPPQLPFFPKNIVIIRGIRENTPPPPGSTLQATPVTSRISPKQKAVALYSFVTIIILLALLIVAINQSKKTTEAEDSSVVDPQILTENPTPTNPPITTPIPTEAPTPIDSTNPPAPTTPT